MTTKTCAFCTTYRLSWTSRVPERGKVGLEVLFDTKPKGEADADETLEVIPVSDILMPVVLDNGKLSSDSCRELKHVLFALRSQAQS